MRHEASSRERHHDKSTFRHAPFAVAVRLGTISIQYNSLSCRDTANPATKTKEKLVRATPRTLAGYQGIDPSAPRYARHRLPADADRHAVRIGAACIHKISGGRRNRQEADSTAVAAGVGCAGCHRDPGNYIVLPSPKMFRKPGSASSRSCGKRCIRTSRIFRCPITTPTKPEPWSRAS